MATGPADDVPPLPPAYDLREKSDFRKLVTLSQTGRSTATTVTSAAVVSGQREDDGVDAEARKLLSFTDNRQDAALQAGHLNDFSQVALLRGALVRALHEIAFDRVGAAIFEALDPLPIHFMREPVDGGPGYEQAKPAMIDLLGRAVWHRIERAIDELQRTTPGDGEELH